VRTTVTLDPDVERLIKQAVQERGVSFKQALNDSIRAGAGSGRKTSKRFTQKTFSMGADQYFRWEKALAAAEGMEDEEISRKLAVRK
jgi:hypothetical protein